MNKILVVVFAIFCIIVSCKKLIPGAPEDIDILEGPIAGLTNEETHRFLNGDAVFVEIFTPATGLGPTFVSNSCVSCHSADGKGHPSNRLTRFGQPDEFGNLFLNQGGPQLQNRAIPGFLPEQLPAGATFSHLIAPSIVGLGYLDFVTDADILAMSDPNDLDGDGISGVPNWSDIPSYVTVRTDAIVQGGKYICRFGKKASAYDLKHQIVKALSEDIGLASAHNPIDVYSHEEVDPEISNQKIVDLNFYLRTLKAPTQRNADDPEVIRGKDIFNQLKCTACHKPKLTTGYSPIAVLSYKEFYPYTDLLLHDMGPGLDDGNTENGAKTYEWRTPPLWGIGLAANSQGGSYFLLHDGRAKTIEGAILYHGGEAAEKKQAYQALSVEDKKALIKFLESL
ncbi:MAG: thiol oxidoreductase [Crocinitomicaceae bacterium]|nr:thiol oxidoreductase [Crocinitomicaceae bacterium]MCF8409893.1 thiol oxidoreductase [Crocinitomicaceae bacterium]